MKKKIFIAALVAATVAGCNKDQTVNPLEKRGEPCSLKVELSGLPDSPITKAAGDQATADKTIKNVQVFVFNKATEKIDAVYYEEGLSVTSGSYTIPAIECTVGERVIWAIVNGPENYTISSAVTNISSLKSRTIRLENEALDFITMSGSADKTLVAGTDAVTVNVSRLVSAVVLTSVENKIAVPSYRDKVYITGAYLLNVPGIQKLDGSILASGGESPTSNWYAWNSKQTSGTSAALLSESITPANIAYNGTHTATHTFYTFANDISATADGSSKSSTVLVVECKINDTDCVYPVYLPTLVANHKYNVSLSIEHIGGDPAQPWKKIEFSQFAPSIQIVPWTDESVSDTI